MVRALHLLCKHQGSRNPVSRRTGASTSGVTKEQAHAELTEIIGRLKDKKGQELCDAFAAEAQKRSDCGSFAQGGDLGDFGPGEMQKAFEDGTMALQVGEMSGIVDTDSGSHIIFRMS
eukprot:TRINITY_DN42830_c0_g1_i1.p1 TRINITY_DN42830_c0_g1~~TRINITY_DN42830_c0_g1_i1.p1  ORF type:complete len:118 (+),score=23.57 TRINITY_DN42830_c0_g1_i1:67-420(+)